MNANESPLSRTRNLVADVIQDDPDRAAAFIELCSLIDNSTPKGSALRSDALRYAFSFTDECRKAMERYVAAFLLPGMMIAFSALASLAGAFAGIA